MKKELILIDASWVIHRMWYVHQDLQVTLLNGQVLKSGHLYGCARLLKSLNTKYPEADILFCLDGVAVHGKQLNPEYKANRSAGEVRTAFDDLGVICECALMFDRTRVAFHRLLEADEVISYFVHACKDAYESIIVYSADGDMLQLLSVGDNIRISKEFNKDGTLKLVNVQEYETDEKYYDKFLACRVDALSRYRAMVGDGSDNLAGFPRIRKKVAKTLAEKYDSVDALAAGCLAGDADFPKNFEQFLPTFRTNYEIMNLPTVGELEERGTVPHVVEKEDGDDTAKWLFSLYRIKSVSPVGTFAMTEFDEDMALGVRSEVNANWRHPNSVPKD